MSSIGSGDPLSSYRYVLLLTRDLSSKESLAITGKFNNVVIADDTYMTAKNDLSQIAFDCLIVDLRNHVIAGWYDEIRSQIVESEAIKVVALYKKSLFTNLDKLILRLEPDSIIKEIPLDVSDAERFLRKLLATKSPRVVTNCFCCISTVDDE